MNYAPRKSLIGNVWLITSFVVIAALALVALHHARVPDQPARDPGAGRIEIEVSTQQGGSAARPLQSPDPPRHEAFQASRDAAETAAQVAAKLSAGH
jgi:hypothetical protein